MSKLVCIRCSIFTSAPNDYRSYFAAHRSLDAFAPPQAQLGLQLIMTGLVRTTSPDGVSGGGTESR